MTFAELQKSLDALPPLPTRIPIHEEITGTREGARDRIKFISADQVALEEARNFENRISFGPRSRAA